MNKTTFAFYTIYCAVEYCFILNVHQIALYKSAGVFEQACIRIPEVSLGVQSDSQNQTRHKPSTHSNIIRVQNQYASCLRSLVSCAVA